LRIWLFHKNYLRKFDPLHFHFHFHFVSSQYMKRAFTFFGAVGFVGAATTTGYCVVVARRPTSEKLHIVLDLDATILQSFPVKHFKNINHSNVRTHDHIILDKEENGEQTGYLIWHRPFAHMSLWFLNQLFVVHLFTAATQNYGDACLYSFPGLFENKRLYRDSVTQKDSHGKDLSLITHDVNRVVLVDDQARNRTRDQGFYHIPPYTRFVKLDFELPKFCAWALHWQLSYDCDKRDHNRDQQ
jgi:hypothetical protein